MDLYFLPDIIHDFLVDFNILILFLFLFVIIIYIVLGFCLSDMNRRLYGTKTFLAWIPIINIYLLGELTFGKSVGFVMCGGFILITLLNIFILPTTLITILNFLYYISLLCILGYAIYRYWDLRRTKNNSNVDNLRLDISSNDELKTNGPTELMVNQIDLIASNKINNINSVPSLNITEEKNYQSPNITFDSDKLQNSNQLSSLLNNNLSGSIIDITKNTIQPKLNNNIDDGKLSNNSDISDINKDNKTDILFSSIPVQENNNNNDNKINVVNGVISDPTDDKKDSEIEKMNIVNGGIISHDIPNNKSESKNSILDINRKL